MNVTDPTLVIIRGINAEWLSQNFTEMWIGFGDAAVAIPKHDANYVGLYMEAPISAITHIGIVGSIERHSSGADFYLKAIIKLKKPVKPEHQIRKHEYWHLEDFGLTHLSILEQRTYDSRYLSIEAINSYIFLSDLSYERNYIDVGIYLERLRVLLSLIDPEMKEAIDHIRLRANSLTGTEDQMEIFDPWMHSVDSVNIEGFGTNGKGDDSGFDPRIFYLTTQPGKISKWIFNLTDRDFFPSIPHGHATVNYSIKLDSYLGHIFKDDKYYGREDRQFIIDLWNDDAFRKNAIETIKFYMREYPKFTWRVTAPLDIPKRRK